MRSREDLGCASFKKGAGDDTLSYAEALDEALCFGWIDGQKYAHDATSSFRDLRRAARRAYGQSGTENI